MVVRTRAFCVNRVRSLCCRLLLSLHTLLLAFISLPNLTSESCDKSLRYPLGTSSGFLGCRLMT